MKRLLPHPLITLSLILMWLLLTSFSVGQLLLGTIVALFAGWAFGAIEPEGPKLKKPWKVVRLFFIVGYDIAKSNVDVAKVILRKPLTGPEGPGFLTVPLRMRDPAPLAILSLIVTATPGSVWINYDPDTGELLLHVLERGGIDWHALIRDRYEAALMEIFA
ncbi:Na+/H+ antiporter subunit E [Paenirhodobacter populi]|uniref:Na+/H+ antiporter subunit E n=1 Tax=Paenirhodobacter populi TaxID=2306993 RepID=A0A443JPS5_9RHOB|nr:Na+/H+ antiporter subunit E [Sinirhodobacter populi]RWR12683.1 Na+/H+ antiporter subunit E [Sinirhodobacter populi]RWR22503.1 Na+/H+ antiporter subunit E [Sinirhodobacter populi]RWR30043.1 Na+/H+ antiporter subunit E [Sinirhodobacter populi]